MIKITMLLRIESANRRWRCSRRIRNREPIPHTTGTKRSRNSHSRNSLLAKLNGDDRGRIRARPGDRENVEIQSELTYVFGSRADRVFAGSDGGIGDFEVGHVFTGLCSAAAND